MVFGPVSHLGWT